MIIIITRWNHQALNSGRHHRIILNQKKERKKIIWNIFFSKNKRSIIISTDHSYPLMQAKKYNVFFCFKHPTFYDDDHHHQQIRRMQWIRLFFFDSLFDSNGKNWRKKCKCSNQFFILSIGHFLFGLLNWMRIEQSKTKKKLSMWIWKKNLRIRIVCMWGKNWCFSFFFARFFLDLAVLRLLFPAIRGSFRPNHGCFRLFFLSFLDLIDAM